MAVLALLAVVAFAGVGWLTLLAMRRPAQDGAPQLSQRRWIVYTVVVAIGLLVVLSALLALNGGFWGRGVTPVVSLAQQPPPALSGVIAAPPAIQPPGCPNIAGTWWRSQDNQTTIISQNGCLITSTLAAPPCCVHNGTGYYLKYNRFYYTLVRTSLTHNCADTMHGYIDVLDINDLRISFYSSDGKCELPTTFTEDSVWQRR
jgi:hypothetical protein